MQKFFSQERIVFLLWLLMFCGFAIALPNFLSYGNLIALIRSVSVLGILAIGMAVVVIGRGIDLSLIATMAISTAFAFMLADGGIPLWFALAIGLTFAVCVGAASGWLIAYVEIPPLFATLAMGAFVYGFGRFALFSQDVIAMPKNAAAIGWIGGGEIWGVPVPILLFVLTAALLAMVLRRTRPGQFIHATGDNPSAARITGLPVRPLTVLQYAISAVIGYGAGLIVATGVTSMNTRIVNSTLIYDVILVVVLGGISLSGGKGGVRNVIVGTLLIGTLLNGMTILDVQYTLQNVIKSFILLLAIIIDSIVNPRDEQTAQQGDI
ncbi:ABC transporter permease [Rhodoligotrophos defluvii]|uniref:ABC transporter permease n=1 Tax=Rhodoligotrophos defluvii TaxID=2561934 RepID=UPI0010C93F78|nr:ABC transporter permease [Rhodoligotrophos defluvii]